MVLGAECVLGVIGVAEVGRPSKLTKDRVDKIVYAIELGASYEHAARAGGVGQSTFHRWMADGAKDDGEPEYREFREAIKEAEARAAQKWLDRIEAAANESWQAAAWKLERRYPQQYGRRVVEAQVTGKGGGPIEVRAVAQRIASDEEASRLAHDLLDRVAGDDADGDASRIGVRRERRPLEAGEASQAAEPEAQ